MKRIYWTWIIPSLLIGFTLGICLGAIIQGKVDEQVVERERMRGLADMEGIVRDMENVSMIIKTKIDEMVSSWYGEESGNITASGEKFNPKAYTAAHKGLAFGTILLVENPENGEAVVVIINDKGPFIKGRELDLSRGAAEKLGLIKRGVATVRVIELWRPK